MISLEITTKIGCPMMCGFCPQPKLIEQYKGERLLSVSAFITAVEKLPRDVQIHFSGYTEPMSNKNFLLMMNYALANGFKVHLYTTLMGLHDQSGMFWGRPEYTRIHVPDTKAMVIGDDKWIREHECWQASRIPATYMTMGELTPRVAEYLGKLGIVPEKPEMLSRGGNLWETPKKTGRIICAMDRWHHNVMLPNGDVYLCCMDYGLSSKLGNLFEGRYETIFVRAEELSNAAQSPAICMSCEWSQQA